MKILKHGKQRIKERRRFKCRSCGCKFIADKTEFYTWVGSLSGNMYYKCNCPECGYECIV